MNNKIFLGGLSGTTSQDDLIRYFTTFGTVNKLDLPKKQNNSKFCKGFGTLTMAEKRAAKRIINQKIHVINDRVVHCRPFLKGSQLKNQVNHFHLKKIFVKDFSPMIRNNDLLEVFQKFGRINDAYIIRELKTRVSRGFGFVIFETEHAAQKAAEAKEIFTKNGELIKILAFKDKKMRKVEKNEDSKLSSGKEVKGNQKKPKLNFKNQNMNSSLVPVESELKPTMRDYHRKSVNFHYLDDLNLCFHKSMYFRPASLGPISTNRFVRRNME